MLFLSPHNYDCGPPTVPKSVTNSRSDAFSALLRLDYSNLHLLQGECTMAKAKKSIGFSADTCFCQTQKRVLPNDFPVSILHSDSNSIGEPLGLRYRLSFCGVQCQNTPCGCTLVMCPLQARQRPGLAADSLPRTAEEVYRAREDKRSRPEAVGVVNSPGTYPKISDQSEKTTMKIIG